MSCTFSFNNSCPSHTVVQFSKNSGTSTLSFNNRIIELGIMYYHCLQHRLWWPVNGLNWLGNSLYSSTP